MPGLHGWWQSVQHSRKMKSLRLKVKLLQLTFAEEELENEMPILNKYSPKSTSNKPLQVATKPNIHSYREMLPWRKRNMQR